VIFGLLPFIAVFFFPPFVSFRVKSAFLVFFFLPLFDQVLGELINLPRPPLLPPFSDLSPPIPDLSTLLVRSFFDSFSSALAPSRPDV